RQLFSLTDDPSPNMIEKARRRLDALVRAGQVVKSSPGAPEPTRYVAAGTHGATHGPSDESEPTADPRQSRNGSESTHAPTHGTHAPVTHGSPPSLKGDDRDCDVRPTGRADRERSRQADKVLDLAEEAGHPAL